MLPVARAIVARMDEAIVIAREQKRVAPSRLRFGAGGSVMALLLLPILAAFLEAHPRRNVELVDADDVSLEDGVVNGELDCAVMTHWGSTRTATQHLLTEEILLLVPNNHPFAALAAVSVELLAKETVLLPSARMNAGNIGAHALRRAGIESALSYRVDHGELKKCLVRQGFGVALMPKLMLCPETIPGLAAVSLDPPIFRELHLIWPLERPLPPLARTLMVDIRAVFANRQKRIRVHGSATACGGAQNAGEC